MELITGGKTDLPEVLCAGSIIVLASRLVILVRAKNPAFPNDWVLPKGHIEPGESALQAAEREAKEETGAIVTLEPKSVGTSTVDIPAHGLHPTERQTITWFTGKCSFLSSENQTDKRGFGLFLPTIALAKLTWPDQRGILAQLLSGEID